MKNLKRKTLLFNIRTGLTSCQKSILISVNFSLSLYVSSSKFSNTLALPYAFLAIPNK